MNAEQVTPIDTRIIKTQYKNYDLLARFWNGRYRGRIWKNKAKVADYTGESIDLIVESLIQIVDRLREKQFTQDAHQSVQFADFVAAWQGLFPTLEKGVLSALTLHARSKEYTITADKLLRVSGIDTVDELLKKYQSVERALRDELLLEFFAEPPTLAPLFNQLPYNVSEPPRKQSLALDKMWADSLIQANQAIREQSA